MNPKPQFLNAMHQAGISPPSEIIDDGSIHRFSTNGKPNNLDGWYVYYSDGIAAGSFGDWKTGVTHTWCAEIGRKLTTEELDAQATRVALMQQQREADDLKAKADAKERAIDIWNKSVKVEVHAYLNKKGVKAYGIKQHGDALVIPLRADGEIQSLQFINADGSKRFLTDGRKKACYFSIGKPQDVIYICEGYATGASIYEATNGAVVVAFDAGNISAVALVIRAKYPSIKLVICADDDQSGIGISKANNAAKLVGASVVIPNFGDSRPDNLTDFNDLHQMKGLNEVRLQIARIAKIAVAEPTETVSTPISKLDVSDAKRLLVVNGWLPPSDLLLESIPPPYPLHALPSVLGDAVREVLEFVQCPTALAVCSALSALSVSAQHLANVQRAKGLSGPVSLYILAIAESGERKSSVDRHFTSAITTWESNQVELMKSDVKRQHVEHEAWQMQFDGLKQKIKEVAKSQKPTDALTKNLHELADTEPALTKVPRLIYGDSTPEQLGYALAKLWPSGAVLSSEAGIVFGSHGMNGDSAMRNLALLNILWDGGVHSVGRRTSECYTVQDARLTMGLAVQADTVRTFFNNSKGLARGTGFLARFLIASPTSTQGTRFFKEPPEAYPKLTLFNQRITELLNIMPTLNAAGGIEPITLELDSPAKLAWIECHDAIEKELRAYGNLSDARDVASKSADNVARLSALFHLYEYGCHGAISIEHVMGAVEIVNWHLLEAKRFLNHIATPDNVANAAKLDAYILRYCREHKSDHLPKNYLRQRCAIRDKKLLNDAIDELVDANRIRVVLDDRTNIIEVNPALLGGDHG